MTKRVRSVARTGLIMVGALLAVALASGQAPTGSIVAKGQDHSVNNTAPGAHATVGDATVTTPDTAQLKKDLAGLEAESQLLYEKLHGITEFQQFLQVQQAIDQARRNLERLEHPAAPPVTPPKR